MKTLVPGRVAELTLSSARAPTSTSASSTSTTMTPRWHPLPPSSAAGWMGPAGRNMTNATVSS
eukprot:1818245-Pyramimonas_sp.AAC.1